MHSLLIELIHNVTVHRDSFFEWNHSQPQALGSVTTHPHPHAALFTSAWSWSFLLKHYHPTPRLYILKLFSDCSLHFLALPSAWLSLEEAVFPTFEAEAVSLVHPTFSKSLSFWRPLSNCFSSFFPWHCQLPSDSNTHLSFISWFQQHLLHCLYCLPKFCKHSCDFNSMEHPANTWPHANLWSYLLPTSAIHTLLNLYQ